MILENYLPPKKENWQGRSSQYENEYIYQVVKLVNLAELNLLQPLLVKNAIALIGFCCDVGVARNQGRIGAKQGPAAIRKQLAKLAWHFPTLQLFDLGDIVCDADDLETAQEELAKLIEWVIKQNALPIVLGGGHELAWGSFQGIHQAKPTANLHIINFDAHFDLRELMDENKGTSGTSFLQIANFCNLQNQAFNYFVLGIQPAANSKSLFDTAKNLGVNYIAAENLMHNDLQQIKNQIDLFLKNTEGVYLTFCLDVMAAAVVPGVSAPQAAGLFPQHVFPILNYIFQQKKIICFDIAELAPRYDIDDHSARFAAQLIYSVFRHYYVSLQKQDHTP